MPALEGGYRDRLIIMSFRETLWTALDELGWFDTDRAHQTVTWREGPVPHDEEIAYNTVVVTFEDDDGTDAELGSNASDIVHTGWVDFYAEPPPPEGMGGEALGKHFIGDVKAILVGAMSSAGRTRPVIDVLDYGMATPARVFSVMVDTERTRTSRIQRAHQPWERWWYTCVFELNEFRPAGGDSDDE